MSTTLGPLRFRRHFVPTVWGGRALETRFGFELPPGKIGESWELVDRANENSIVDGGAFDGQTLRELMQTRATEILGTAVPARDGRFPLLVKYIDAEQNLSVQVHPDEDAAAQLGGDAEPKTEAWYVLNANGDLYAGLTAGVGREQFESIAQTPAVVDALERHSVQAGDCVLVRGGTVHAIGAGVTILEVQQNSDTTYRLYDWGRVGADGEPRATHPEQALASVRYAPAPRVAVPEWHAEATGVSRAHLCACSLFKMEGLRLEGEVRLAESAAFRILVVIHGSGRLLHGGSTMRLSTGDVWLLPASMGPLALDPDPKLELVLTTPEAGDGH